MQTKVERQHDKEPPETGSYIFPSLAQSPCSIVLFSVALVRRVTRKKFRRKIVVFEVYLAFFDEVKKSIFKFSFVQSIIQ